jgi:molybdate transport system substrate-binding protein
MDQLAAEFKAKDSIAVEVLPGASGTLAAQILHGAPYDIFLSADTAFPRQVALGGEGIGEMKILMYGALVFYARAPFDSADWRKVIVADSTAKIAIANPLAAPYGAAAVQALKYNSLYERVQGRFVQGESISQVNGFLTSGAAPMGFTAKANVISGPLSQRGSWVEIDHSSYSPLAHGLLLLRHSSGNSGAVQKFMDFLFSRDALEVLARFGYTVR